MWRRFGKIPLLPLCAAGFLVGILLCLRGKAEGTLLAPASLQEIKNMSIDKSGILYQVCKIRLGTVLLLLVAGTTYLAPLFCGGFSFWLGMGGGYFLTQAVMRYGIKGVLLLPAGCFPHYLLYLPAFYMLLLWCERLYGYIYLKREFPGWGSTAARLILILLAVFAGIFLESHVNPGILQGMLKNF